MRDVDKIVKIYGDHFDKVVTEKSDAQEKLDFLSKMSRQLDIQEANTKQLEQMLAESRKRLSLV